MSLGLLHLLRGIHVLAGSFWFGAAAMNTLFVAPAVRSLGAATGGQFMRELVQRGKLPLFMNGAATLTILSGIVLYGWRSAWFTSEWMATRSGAAFGAGGVFAIVAFAYGMLVIGRTAGRLGRLAAEAQATGGAPLPEVATEMQRLQARMTRGSKIGLVLVTLATLLMAVARYI